MQEALAGEQLPLPFDDYLSNYPAHASPEALPLIVCVCVCVCVCHLVCQEEGKKKRKHSVFDVK